MEAVNPRDGQVRDAEPHGRGGDEIESRSYAPVDVEILPDCRHAPHLDQPDRTLAAIAEFAARLARIEAAAGAPA